MEKIFEKGQKFLSKKMSRQKVLRHQFYKIVQMRTLLPLSGAKFENYLLLAA